MRVAATPLLLCLFPHICSSKGSETRDNARSNMACPLSDSSCCVHTKRRGWCNSRGTLEAFLPFRTTCTSSAFMYGRLLMKPSAMKWHGHKKAGRIHVCSNRVFNRYGISSGRPILCTTGNFQQPRGNSSRRNILSYVRYDDINIVLFKLIIKKTDC